MNTTSNKKPLPKTLFPVGATLLIVAFNDEDGRTLYHYSRNSEITPRSVSVGMVFGEAVTSTPDGQVRFPLILRAAADPFSCNVKQGDISVHESLIGARIAIVRGLSPTLLGGTCAAIVQDGTDLYHDIGKANSLHGSPATYQYLQSAENRVRMALAHLTADDLKP